MTKNNIKILKNSLIIAIVFLTFSCNHTPELVEPLPTASTNDRLGDTFGRPVLSLPVTLDRVKIFTHSGLMVSGVVTVEIASGDGSVILGSSVLPGSSMIGDKWTTFYFAPLTLMAGTKYRIQVKRSSEPINIHDAISWGASDGSIDAYPEGETSISGTYPYDMAFITYSDGYVDQQQTAHTHFWGISKLVHWQEFVPEKIWVIQP